MPSGYWVSTWRFCLPICCQCSNPWASTSNIKKGEGPVIHNPIRDASQVDRFHELEDLGSMHFVFDAVKLIRRDLPGNIPLLGFAGAPFTLASYAIEGGGGHEIISSPKE